MASPECLVLAPGFRVGQIGDKLLLYDGQRLATFEGRAALWMADLLPLLNGQKTVSSIMQAVPAAQRLWARNAVKALGQAGIVAPQTCRTTADLLAMISLQGGWRDSVKDHVVHILGTDEIAALTAETLLRDDFSVHTHQGWSVAFDDGIVVAVLGPDDVKHVQEFNRLMLDHSRSYIPVLPFNGRMISVGPVVVPGAGPCLYCYLCRRTANFSPFIDLLSSGAWSAQPPRTMKLLAAGTIAWLVGQTMAEGVGRRSGCLVTIDGTTLAVEHSIVFRVPRCPECSGQLRSAPFRPWTELNSEP